MEEAATLLWQSGPKNVLLKGGHLPGDPLDLLFDGRRMIAHKRRRTGRQVHGTGCALSSLMLSLLTLGYPLAEAFTQSEQLMDVLLADSYQLDEHGYWYSNLTRIGCRENKRLQPGKIASSMPAGALLTS